MTKNVTPMLHQCYSRCNTFSLCYDWDKQQMLQMLHLFYKKEKLGHRFFSKNFFGVTSVTFAPKTLVSEG